MIRTAKKIKNLSITEQGAGVFNLDEFFNLVVNSYNQRQKALIHPARLDLRRNSTYFLPVSRQSIYATMMPVSLNVTLMNHQALHSQILSAYYDEPEEL
jgi:hypothetical protein